MQTTITAWAFLYDALIFYSWYQASFTWSQDRRTQLFVFLFTWTFVFSKTVKLWGHFFRYPADVIFIPIYVSFGYFHGLIKLWGLLTLSEVSSDFELVRGEAVITDRLFAIDDLGKQRRRRRRRSHPYDSFTTIHYRWTIFWSEINNF